MSENKSFTEEQKKNVSIEMKLYWAKKKQMQNEQINLAQSENINDKNINDDIAQ